MRYVIFHPSPTIWYWELLGRDGRTVARSAVHFSTERSCEAAIIEARWGGPSAPIERG